MKLLPSEIEAFIKNISSKQVKGILLFGSDLSVLLARENQLKSAFQKSEHVKIDLNAEAKLQDVYTEAFTPSLFFEAKFITINGSDAKFLNFEELASKITNTYENFILLTIQENLNTNSKIRKLFEVNNLLAAIPCYKQEGALLLQTVKTLFLNAKLSADAEVFEFIISKFADNLESLKLEIEKLKLYKGEGKVTIFEAKVIMDGEEEEDIFETVNLFFEMNFKKFLQETQKFTQTTLPPSVLLTNIINYNFKLIEIIEEKELTSKTFEAIINEKGIFFKQIPKIKSHLSKWNKTMLVELSFLLLKCEIETRKNTNLGYSVFNFLTAKITETLNK